MKKLYILSAIAVIAILTVFSGCGGSTPATTTPTTTTPTTTTAEETPATIEVEYELVGAETYSLVAIHQLQASATSSQAFVSGVVESIKNAKAFITMTAEFYDGSGTLVGSVDREYILDGVVVLRDIGFELLFYNDDHTQIEKCILLVDAKE